MDNKPVVLVLCLARVVLVVTLCQDYPVFKSCECSDIEYLGKQQYVLNCTNTAITNVSILAQLPHQVQVLLFVGNNIPDLPWNVFGTGKNLTNLRVIDLSNNNIAIIHGKSFHRVSTVERLILNHNHITISSTHNIHHPRIFSNFESLLELHLSDAFADKGDSLVADLEDIFYHSELKRLRKLHLEQNNITSLRQSHIFCQLPSLMDIYLGDNSVEELELELECLTQLRFIDLQDNKISSISNRDLSHLNSLSNRGLNITLDLTNNPLLCGPQLEAFYSLLDCSKINLRNKDKLKCRKSGENRQCSVVINPVSCSGVREYVEGKTGLHHSHGLLATALLISLLTNIYLIYRRLYPTDPITTWFKSYSTAFTSSAVHYTKQSNLDDL